MAKIYISLRPRDLKFSIQMAFDTDLHFIEELDWLLLRNIEI